MIDFFADFVLVIHALFIVFVIFGGLCLLKSHRLIWLHIPCAIWGAVIEFSGGICPLTYLENHLRRAGNADHYANSFIQHYLPPIIYPDSLTAGMQLILGGLVILINLMIYSLVWRFRKSNSALRIKTGT